MTNREKTIKFHGTKVANITILYAVKPRSGGDIETLEEFNAAKNPEICETLNTQVVADYITITFYRKESSNSIIRRELIPTHLVQHIWVQDM
jgi:hypothetical protein